MAHPTRNRLAMFNLAPPPNFRGLDPDKAITSYERHLPHWRQEGATYFVTFRLGDSLPRMKLDYLKRFRQHWEQTHPVPRSQPVLEEYSREVFQRIERWLDEGYGACHFRDPRHAEQLEEALHHFHGTRY